MCMYKNALTLYSSRNVTFRTRKPIRRTGINHYILRSRDENSTENPEKINKNPRTLPGMIQSKQLWHRACNVMLGKQEPEQLQFIHEGDRKWLLESACFSCLHYRRQETASNIMHHLYIFSCDFEVLDDLPKLGRMWCHVRTLYRWMFCQEFEVRFNSL
jgi:hypothetical protein